MNFIRNAKIGTKIYAGFFLVLIIMAGIVTITMQGLQDINDEFYSYKSLVLTGNNVAEINKNIFKTKGEVLTWIRTKDPELLQKIAKDKENIQADIEKAKASLKDPQQRAEMQSIETAFKAFVEETKNIENVQLQQELNAKLDNIAVLGADIAKSADSLRISLASSQDDLYAEFSATKSQVSNTTLVLGFVGFILAITIAYFITRQIVKPVRAMQSAVDNLAQGDLTVNMPYTDGKDEIAQMCNKVDGFVKKLRDVVSSIKSISTDVSHNSDDMAESSNGLASRAEQQASTLEETAASMEELTSTVKTNADNAKEANQAAVETRSIAEQGSKVANDAGAAMQKINESSKEITDIINVIDEIAFQTNLLALNAAVEAARAGDAGRGFAVVAQEVRTLAQRSAQSSKDIKSLIDNSSKQVEDGVNLVETAVSALQKIHEAINSVADSVGQISTASTEQATSLDELNQAVMDMDSMTQQNASMAQQTRNVASMMQSSSSELADMVSFFKVAANEVAARKAPVSDNPVGFSSVTSQSAKPVKAANTKKSNGKANGMADHDYPAQAKAVEGQDSFNDADWKEF